MRTYSWILSGALLSGLSACLSSTTTPTIPMSTTGGISSSTQGTGLSSGVDPISSQGNLGLSSSNNGTLGKSSATLGVSSSSNVNIGSTTIGQIMTETQFMQIFPIMDPTKRSTYSACQQKHLSTATYQAFVNAAAKFPKFLNEGSLEDRKRELAAFFANVGKETTGGWDTAPGGYEAWGLCFVEEQGYVNGGIGYTGSNDPDYQAVSGQSYHGRGPIQISYPYNYGPFSQSFYGDKNVLLQNPAKVITDGAAFWASAIWFWMNEAVAPGMTAPGGIAPEGQYYKPSCHMVMTNTWTPRSSDLNYKRTEGLGATINIINGGLECGGSWDSRGQGRVKNYKKFAQVLGISEIPAGKDATTWETCQLQTSFSTP